MPSSAHVSQQIAPPAAPAVENLRAELGILESYLITALPQLFPKLFDDKIVIAPIEHQGQLNETLLVHGIGGKEYIVKVSQPETWLDRDPKESPIWSRYHKEQFFLDSVNQLDAIRGLAPNIPAIAYLLPEQLPPALFELQGVKPNAPYAVSIQTKLPGVPLSSILSCLPETEYFDAMTKIGEMTHAIHSIPTHGVGRDYDSETGMFTDYRTAWRQIDSTISSCRLEFLLEKGFITSSQRDKLLTRFEEYRDNATAPCLSHGDTHFGNILYAPEKKAVSGLIDWEIVSSISSKFHDIARQLILALERVRENENPPQELRMKGFLAYLRGYGFGEKPFQGTNKREILTAALLETLPNIAFLLQEPTTPTGAPTEVLRPKRQNPVGNHTQARRARFNLARELIAELELDT